jgi:ribonuclease J
LPNSHSELVFVALGGLGEIGMNAALYGYGPPGKRQWLLVDLGVAFAGDDLPGVDLIMPDLTFLEQERKNLLAIVLTHAHEDHIGAVSELWPRLKVPVYATRFTIDLLGVRRLGEPGAPDVPFKHLPQGGRATIGPFDIEFVPVAHSIPESNALVIRTPAGTVLHSGDWKIDPTPPLGLPTDEARLRALGDEGVLALVCDSTNVVREGESPSEKAVAACLREQIATAPHRVAVTTFASNVTRLRAVAEAARDAGREVVIAGRAMERVVDVARELGMLDGLPPFRGFDVFQRLPRHKIVTLLTGSQGERRAALARIAEGEHPSIRLDEGDRLIFSSRAIPGNEKEINRIINALSQRGVEIVTDRHALVHVSGHPRRDELRRMYEWIRPRIAVPAHGEALHLTEHAALAKSLGVSTVIRAFNGEIVRFAPDPAGVIAAAPVGRLYKDGEVLLAPEDEAVRERRKLSFVGLVSVALCVDRGGKVTSGPEIAVNGLPQRTKDGRDMSDLVLDTVNELIDSLPRTVRRDPEAVETAIEKAVRNAVAAAWGKKPVCHVLVMEG